MQLNLDNLLKTIWDYLGLVRVYTKKKGQQPNFDEPIVLTGSIPSNHMPLPYVPSPCSWTKWCDSRSGMSSSAQTNGRELEICTRMGKWEANLFFHAVLSFSISGLECKACSPAVWLGAFLAGRGCAANSSQNSRGAAPRQKLWAESASILQRVPWKEEEEGQTQDLNVAWCLLDYL